LDIKGVRHTLKPITHNVNYTEKPERASKVVAEYNSYHYGPVVRMPNIMADQLDSWTNTIHILMAIYGWVTRLLAEYNSYD